MLIALLALLGVDLIVIVGLLAILLARRRWVTHQRGVFPGAIRVTDGAIDGLPAKWSRGYGRWVGDVLVWTKKPLLFRNEFVAADGLGGPRAAVPGELKRLGDHPVVYRVTSGHAAADVAIREQDCALVRAPFTS